MIEILPSINAQTFEEVQEQIKKVEPYVSWCHLDVTDGIFSKHITWNNPLNLPKLSTTLKVEAHLMVTNPEKILDQWLVAPVKRIVVHLEAAGDMEFIIEQCHASDIEIGLAINPETYWGRIESWFDQIDMVQVLAVHPGPSGQKLTSEMYDKINCIRMCCPMCVIEIDGGMNNETVPIAAHAGANLFVAGSYIFDAGDIGQAVKELKDFALKNKIAEGSEADYNIRRNICRTCMTTPYHST